MAQTQYLYLPTPYQRPTNALLTPTPRRRMARGEIGCAQYKFATGQPDRKYFFGEIWKKVYLCIVGESTHGRQPTGKQTVTDNNCIAREE